MILAIDFDDTIHDPHNRKPGYKLGTPMQGAIEALKTLTSQGHEYIVHSVWADSEAGQREIGKWLAYFGAPLPKRITAQKPAADWYIDDRAMHFDNWDNVLNKLGANL